MVKFQNKRTQPKNWGRDIQKACIWTSSDFVKGDIYYRTGEGLLRWDGRMWQPIQIK